MIRVDVEQGSEAWFACRLGVPTASCFDRILTPTGKTSTQAEAYAHTLLAEALTGQHCGWEGNGHTERGKEFEPEARALYGFLRGIEVEQVGFCLSDDKLAGCSPDGLVGDCGGLEIKAPAAHTHVKYLLGNKLPTDYIPQVQGSLYVTGREWWDFLSYFPGMPPLLVRVERDPAYIALLDAELRKFDLNLKVKTKLLQARLGA